MISENKYTGKYKKKKFRESHFSQNKMLTEPEIFKLELVRPKCVKSTKFNQDQPTSITMKTILTVTETTTTTATRRVTTVATNKVTSMTTTTITCVLKLIKNYERPCWPIAAI